MTDADDAEQAAELRRRAEQDDPNSIDVGEVESLLEAGDATVRRDATEAAARLSTGSTDRLLTLTPLLADRLHDESAAVRANAAMALAAIAETDPERVRSHVSTLASSLSDSDAKVRASAALALSNVAVEAPDTVAATVDAAVIESLLTDASRDVRSNGIELLAELAGRGVEGVLGGAVRERLTELLEDDAWFVRERACLALGVVGDENDRQRLEERAATDTNDMVRETAEASLERLEGGD